MAVAVAGAWALAEAGAGVRVRGCAWVDLGVETQVRVCVGDSIRTRTGAGTRAAWAGVGYCQRLGLGPEFR